MWIFTSSNDDVQMRRQILEEESEGCVNRFGLDRVVVIEDKDKIARDGGNIIEQRCQNQFDGGWLWSS